MRAFPALPPVRTAAVTGGSSGGGGSFDYIGTNALSAYGASALKTGVTRCFRVRRSSDNAEQDCLTITEAVAFCGAGNGFVAKVYDQVGANDLVQATTTLQPKIVSSGVAEIGIKGDGTDDRLVGTTNVGISGAGARTFLFTVKLAATGFQTILAYGTQAATGNKFQLIAWSNNGFKVDAYFTGPTFGPGSLVDTEVRKHAVTYDGTTVKWYIDGTQIGSGAATLDTVDTVLTLLAKPSGLGNGDNSSGSICDVRVYNVAKTQAEIQALQA